MAYSYNTQNKGFMAFLVLVIITVFNFVVMADAPFAWGMLAIIWGMFGFFRIIDLTYDKFGAVPKFLNLPFQILFGADKRQEESRKLVLKRLGHSDVLFWLLGSMLYVAWAVYNGLNPSRIDLQAAFNLPSIIAIQEIEDISKINLYAFLSGLSYLAMLTSAIFIALSYSQSRRHVHRALVILTVFFIIGLVGGVITDDLRLSNAVLWPDMSFIRGYGFDSDPANIIIHSLGIEGGETAFIKRFIALGSVGAYGVYVLFVPAAYMLIKTIFSKARTVLRPLMGLGSLVALGLFDVMALSTDWVSYLSFLLLTCAVLCWGSVIRYK